MRVFKFVFIFSILPLFAFTTMHKYYISVTQVDYVQEKESLQIISRIFIDDFENVLRTNYDENIILAGKDEPKAVDSLMNTYLQSNLKLEINNKPVLFNFIGKAYDGDIVRCYLEVEQVKYINVFSITNSILLDYQENQQNIVKTKINSQNKSFILTSNNTNALLKFN
ncbi:MAG: DUF6702 family protein [Algibacter sp.]|uniref:DUF6702 family protein n=1 Tax=Algibacter sp. TaxID=1872428 RepID=UPI0032998A92